MKSKNKLVHAALVEPGDVGVAQPSLVTLPNVELLEVGTDWATSTGTFDFDMEDLKSCIASQDDPAVRTPVVKLGHIDPRFDGQPAIGRIENLRLTNNDQTLVGDLVAMPLWLAKVMYTAYPRRSIEGNLDVTTRTGNTWDMVLTGVALLGTSYPAIDTLEDIQALWGENPPPLYTMEETEPAIAAGAFRSRKVDMKTRRNKNVDAGAEVKASVNLDNVKTAYYAMLDASGNGMWWWCREVRVNPMTLIVDDDEGSLWEVPVSIDSNDEISFGEHVEVKVQYVAAGGTLVAASQAGQIVAASHATPEDAGRTSRPNPEDEAKVTASNIPEQEEKTVMLTDEALIALGLEPGATNEEISAAVLANKVASGEPDLTNDAPADTPKAETDAGEVADAEVSIPEGMVLVDATMLAEMRSGVAAAAGLVKRQDKADRDAVLDTAIRAGKFPIARRVHYETMLSADPVGASALISSLEAGLVPVTETGEGNDVAAADETAYPSNWKRAIEASHTTSNDRVKVTSD